MTPFEQAVGEVADGYMDAAQRVVENDPLGRCVTIDLYALGLNAAKRHHVNPVRVLTAVIDLAWGNRDYLRGPKLVDHPNYTPWWTA